MYRFIFILFVGMQKEAIKCNKHGFEVKQTHVHTLAVKREASCLGFGASASSSVE